MIARLILTLRHLFTPHHTNNFRARLLHNAGFLVVIGLYFSIQLFVRLLDSSSWHILGFTSSVTIEEVVAKTNEERLAAGLSPLKYSEVLSDAARRKAANMLEENYWAHNSPSGHTPWEWFNAAGYKYTHAGENLAKDFASTDRMIAAWMASPTHRENIVNAKFEDIGIAVVPGTLLGSDTVLVVQLFGSTAAGSVTSQASAPQVAAVQGAEVAPTPVPVTTPAPTIVPVTTPEPAPVLELKEFNTTPTQNSFLFDEFDVKRAVSLATTGLLILVLLLDLLIAESKKLSRRVGKNWAHILYINVILIVVTIVNAGSIV